MPVRHLTDQHARILAYYFLARVTREEVVAAVRATVEAAFPDRAYKGLLVFHPSADLTEMSHDDLHDIRRSVRECHQAAGLGCPTGAIVVDGSIEAESVRPLWKAMCDADAEADPVTDIHYRFFIDVGPALAWLDVIETAELQKLLESRE